MYKYIPSIPIYARRHFELDWSDSIELLSLLLTTLWIESRPCAKYYDAQFYSLLDCDSHTFLRGLFLNQTEGPAEIQ